MFATLELPLRDDSRHKRLKVGRACHPCRMKKIKCDGKQPCMQCKARRRKCMYLKNTDETYIKLDPVADASFLQDIAEQTQEQQQRFQRQQTPDDYSQASTPQSNGSSQQAIYIADKGDALFSGTQKNDQIQHPATRSDRMIEQLADGLVRLTLHNEPYKLADDNVTPWRSYGDFVRWTPEPGLPSYYTAPIDMPARQIQENLINVFFSHCHHTLPTLSRSMFFEQLNAKGPLVTPLLLNVMYAHAAKHVDDPSFLSHPDKQGNVFYIRARRLVDDFLDTPRVSTVIALLYMAAYEYNATGSETGARSSRAWMYSGMAVRMCLELGLHTANYSSQMSQFDIELRRRVLWTCYVMDKLESCMTERPWMLRAKDISLDFPTPLPEDTTDERIVLDGFSQLCRLMILIEKVLHTFAYETRDKGVWTMHEESQTLQLLEQVSQWRDNLPSSLRWTPTSPGTAANGNGTHHFIPSPIPSSHVVANLHLVCCCLELSLVMCCRYQDEQLHRERRRGLANAITQLVSLTVEHPRLMYTSTVSAFAAIFASLTHVADFDHPLLADDARMQFRKSLEDVRTILQRVPLRDMRNLTRLVDLTHAILGTNGTSTSNATYTSAFSAITDICQEQPDPNMLFSTTASTSTTATTAATSPASLFSPSMAYSTAIAPSSAAAFTFDPTTCLPSTPSTAAVAAAAAAGVNTTTTSAPSNTAAAKAAAAAAVGAVGPPTSGPPKNIEPADYTFQLISVADEWARALMYHQ
ncbi:hypothetical protein LRAMOSA05226 [Lichtheimia ramosa]|uniref:Zn(2)-C6 fungal-type domain-containing protein n=1 Tax=Lichtheimia ramosa TaxID=688394 RepID=A0A077X1Z6_9FUNG|nr:hypothetical protein LRAMOSA05226 [Lichtheimia ramosa]